MNGTIPSEHIPSLPIPPPENESKVLNKLFWSKFPTKASRFTPPRGIYIPSRDKARYAKSMRNFPGNGPLKKSPKSMELSSIAAANPLAEVGFSFFELEALSNFCDNRPRKLSQVAFRPELQSELMPKGSKTGASVLQSNLKQQQGDMEFDINMYKSAYRYMEYFILSLFFLFF